MVSRIGKNKNLPTFMSIQGQQTFQDSGRNAEVWTPMRPWTKDSSRCSSSGGIFRSRGGSKVGLAHSRPQVNTFEIDPASSTQHDAANIDNIENKKRQLMPKLQNCKPKDWKADVHSTAVSMDRSHSGKTVPIVGLIDTSLVDNSLPVSSFHGSHRDIGMPASMARKTTAKMTPRTEEVGRWRGSQGRILSLDERGPHNRAHDRRLSYIALPRTAPHRDNMSTPRSRIGTAFTLPSRLSPFQDTTSTISDITNVERQHDNDTTVPKFNLSKPSGPLGMAFVPMSWEDPFIPQRRALIQRSRRLKTAEALTGNLETSGSQTARENRAHSAAENVRGPAPLSARLPSSYRKSSQSSRPVPLAQQQLDHLGEDITVLTGLVAEAEFQLKHGLHLKQKRSLQAQREIQSQREKAHRRIKILSDFEVPWDIQTKVEESQKPMSEDNGLDLKPGTDIIEYLGQRYEHFLNFDVVRPMMNEIRWGDRNVSIQQCGLQELGESLQHTTHLGDDFVQTIKEADSFIHEMNMGRNKSIMLEGMAHSHVTTALAQEYMENFVEPAKRKTPEPDNPYDREEIDVHNLNSDNLDTILGNLVKNKDRSKLFEKKTDSLKNQTIATIAQKTKQDGPQDSVDGLDDSPQVRSGRAFMRTTELMAHAEFHRDLEYVRYKTDGFKRECVEQLEGLSHPVEKLENKKKAQLMTDRSLHYLNFTILQAENLPSMDERKHSQDLYVQCSLYHDDQLMKIEHGDKDQSVVTKVCWDTRIPVWNQNFMFTVPFVNSGEVYLLLEVLDSAFMDTRDHDDDEDNLARIPDDTVLGHVKFCILKDGIQVMTPEQESTDWYYLRDHNGEEVRYNFGVANAVLKGKTSVLKVHLRYTKKPRKPYDDYIVMLQCNIRMLIAKRAMAAAGHLLQQRKRRVELLPEFESDKKEDHIWSMFQKKCEELETHPVSLLQDQLSSGGVVLSHYPINLTIITAMSSVLIKPLKESRLTKISLTHMNINSMGLQNLADALCSIENCPLLILILDGNPLSKCPAYRQDSSQGPFSLDSTCQDPLVARPNRNTFCSAGAEALTTIIKTIDGLSHLSVAQCQLRNSGLVEVAGAVKNHESITFLNMSDNEASDNGGNDLLKASIAIGEMIEGNSTLLQLSYEGNNLNRKCGLAFLGGAGSQGNLNKGIMMNYTLRTLNIARTGACRTLAGVQTLAQLLARKGSPLETLNISRCGLTGDFMESLTQGLDASNLKYLILDGNRIQTPCDGFKVLMRRKGRKRYVVGFEEKADENIGRPADRRLSVHEVQRLFDDHSHMGALRKDINQLRHLLDTLGFDWSFEEVKCAFNKMDSNYNDEVDFREFYKWYVNEMRITEEGEPVLQISLRDCGVTPKDADFQPDNPSGIYDLDMFFMRSRNIVQALMTEELSGRGRFVADSVKRIFLSDTGMEETTDFILDVFGGQDIPDSGWLTFEFKGCLSSRYQNDVWLLTDRSMMAIQQVFTDPKATHSTRCSILDQYFCGKTKVIFKQAVKILSWTKVASSTEVSTIGVQLHPVQAPELGTTGIVVSVTRTLDAAHRRIDYIEKILPAHERIDYIEKILPALNSRRRDLRLFDVLEEWEKQEAYTRLRMLPPRRQVSRTLNSTGYYRFNLRQLDIRDSCIDLVSMTGNDLKNALACFRDFGLGHKGGPRSRVDLAWQNARYCGRILLVEKEINIKQYSVPFHGFLEVDFVDIRKPDVEEEPMNSTQFLSFLSLLKKPGLAARGILEQILEISLSSYFTCLQVIMLLQFFKGADAGYRVEVCVALFSRTVDWRAFHYVIRYSGRRESHIVSQRLGRLNLFFDGASTAVGHWQLDLSISQERYIMQELLHFAENEPGQNVVLCVYQDEPFDIPVSWIDKVPVTGCISFFYVRTKQTNEKCLQYGSFDKQSVRGCAPMPKHYPAKFKVPAVPDGFSPGDKYSAPWIPMETARLIKESMQCFVDSAERIFDVLDADGSSTIDRKEFVNGLTRLGIVLNPSELRTMLEVLDCDRSGDINLSEWKEFWTLAPPLRWRDEAQEFFWNKRGFRGKIYEECVEFYDIRRHYPEEMVDEYHLLSPGALSVHNELQRSK